MGRGGRGHESALNDVVVAASSLLDPSSLAAVSVAQVRRLLGVDGASLTFWDDDQRVLVPLASDDPRMVDPDPVFHAGQGLTGEAFARDATVVASDYDRQVTHPPAWTSVRSGMAVPLRADGRPLGALSAQHYTRREFSADDVALLELVAAQVGPALGTMRTLARAQRRTAEAYALASLMRRGATLRSEDELFALVVQSAVRLLGADLAGLVLRDSAGDGSGWRGVVGNRTDAWEHRHYGGDHPAAATIYGDSTQVIRGAGGGVLDAERFPFFAAEGIRSGVAVPLEAADGSRGSLCLGWRFTVEPAAGQLGLAEALAGFAGTLVTAAAARAQREALVGTAPVVLAAMDADGILTLCEGAGARAVGLGPDDVGRHITDVLAGAPDVLAAIQEAIRGDRPARLALEMRGRAFDAWIVMRDGRTFLVATDVTERRLAERELAWRAERDELTGLPNVIEVVRQMGAALAASPVSVVLADVRNFGHVNEMIGYEAGDELLQALGARLSRDIAGVIVIGRTGGDEFAVTVPGTDALALGGQVRTSLEAPVDRGGGEALSIDVRCGVASMAAGDDAQQLFRHADAALQLARRGQDAVAAWDGEAATGRRRQLAFTADLRRALDARAFSVHYQPIVAVGDDALHHVEALARWTDAGGERPGPAVFVPLLERLGRVGQLTALVLDRALAEVAAPHGIGVSVNVSPLDVVHGDLVALVTERLSAYGLDPGMLTLEITESAALEAGTAALAELSALGVAIAVDDFGRGWSSLELLKRLPASRLMLDRSLCLGGDP